MSNQKLTQKLYEALLLPPETSLFQEQIHAVLKELDPFQKQYAFSLVDSWKKWKKQEISKEDFLLVLRDFLNVFDTTFPQELIEISHDNEFGIQSDSEGSYYAIRNEFPDQIPDRFILDVYNGKLSPADIADKKMNLVADHFIRSLTGYDAFRSAAQKLALYGALKTPQGYTTLVSLPTGGGKSLIIQALAYQNPGLTIVIVPTVALAMDQKRSCDKVIKRMNLDKEIRSYTGGDNDQIPLGLIRERKLKLLFVSPETLMKNPRFKDELVRNADYISNIVIDEAHLVGEWGNTFRVDFQCLKGWRRDLMDRNPRIRTFLLSATFEESTVVLLKKLFSEKDRWIEIRCDALRKEPRFVTFLSSRERQQKELFLKMVRTLPHPMIVYVNNPDAADHYAELLKEEANLRNLRVFTGSTRNKDRREIIQSWSRNEIPLIIATNAFGVGVDKSNVRTVLHMNLPTSSNSYYQELGRGGRDRRAALSILNLTNPGSEKEAKQKLTKKILTTGKMLDRWKAMLNSARFMKKTASILISTSIRPDYQKVEEVDLNTRVGDMNVDWNVKLLLMLAKYDLIDIQRISFNSNTGNYEFELRILDDCLVPPSQKTLKFFDEIRGAEYRSLLGDINNLWKMVKQSSKGSECWSELFTECYVYADEYCAGCKAHSGINDETTKNVIKKRIRTRAFTLDAELESIIGDVQECIVTGSPEKRVRFAQSLGMNVLVTGSDSNLEYLIKSMDEKPCMIISFGDFSSLLKEGYIVSGLVGVLYAEDENKAIEEFQRMINSLSPVFTDRSSFVLVHMLKEDLYLQRIGKRISETIHGPLIEK